MRTIIHHHTLGDDLNFLTALSGMNCPTSGDPFLVIKTAFAAGVPTLYAFNQFSCLDIVALRAGISWKCGKTIKPIARQGIAPWAGFATDFLYKWGPAQLREGLWYYFIANEAAHFLARWTSMLYVGQGCDLPPEGSCSVAAVATPFGVLFPGGESIMTALTGCHSTCGQCSGRDISAHAGCSVNIIPMLTWVPALPGEPPSSVTCSVEEKDSGEVKASLQNTSNSDTGAGNGYVFAPNLPSGILGDTVYNVRVTNNGPGIVLFTSGHFNIQWSGYRSETIPAGCVPKSAHL